MNVQVWRLMAHHEPTNPEAVVEWSRQAGRIAIDWSEIGNIHSYASSAEIVEAGREIYPDLPNVPVCGVQLWNFCHAMQPQDLVILNTQKYRAVVMQVQGAYEYVPVAQAPFFGYQHQRTVLVTQINPDHL